ncbi:MAG: ribonuclease III [Coleofasciculaceae cyanobacterium SM2_1_6]|nr:ribonuclease III [Coleofasciculaceae cyanobacterium SM2_1_6]
MRRSKNLNPPSFCPISSLVYILDESHTPITPISFGRIQAVAITNHQLRQLSPTVLAYLGDGVYELYVRAVYLQPQRLQAYHQRVVAQVRAESQAAQLTKILPLLTPDELEIVRRGRNAVKKSPKRLAVDIYQQATSLETLIGYLYLHDLDRLLDLLSKFDFD